MSCPYFEEGYVATCGASASQYVPNIEMMETYCFKQTYGLCPILSEYLFKYDMAMGNCIPKRHLSNR